MTGDMRVTAAREYLASVRKHKVTALPPSVLLRECAELRRQLGQVLDFIEHQAPPLTEAQRATVRDGLADAADLLEHRAGQWCGDCETAPDECCGEHAADLDAAGRYRALERDLTAGGAR